MLQPGHWCYIADARCYNFRGLVLHIPERCYTSSERCYNTRIGEIGSPWQERTGRSGMNFSHRSTLNRPRGKKATGGLHERPIIAVFIRPGRARRSLEAGRIMGSRADNAAGLLILIAAAVREYSVVAYRGSPWAASPRGAVSAGGGGAVSATGHPAGA